MRMSKIPYSLFFSFFFSLQVFAFNLPKSCDHLFLPGCSEKSKANYRLNFQSYQLCLKDLSLIPAAHHFLNLKTLESIDGLPFFHLKIKPKAKVRKSVLLTAGIHGDEAIGPVAVLKFLQRALSTSENRNTEFSIFPMLNPWGLKECTRHGRYGKNLNRELKRESTSKLFSILSKTLVDKKFDAALDIHEASGFKTFFVIANDEQDMQQANAALVVYNHQHLFQSPTKKYPYQRTPKSYKFYAPGVSTSSNRGTVKAFFKYNLNIPFALTTEHRDECL